MRTQRGGVRENLAVSFSSFAGIPWESRCYVRRRRFGASVKTWHMHLLLGDGRPNRRMSPAVGRIAFQQPSPLPLPFAQVPVEVEQTMRTRRVCCAPTMRKSPSVPAEPCQPRRAPDHEEHVVSQRSPNAFTPAEHASGPKQSEAQARRANSLACASFVASVLYSSATYRSRGNIMSKLATRSAASAITCAP